MAWNALRALSSCWIFRSLYDFFLLMICPIGNINETHRNFGSFFFCVTFTFLPEFRFHSNTLPLNFNRITTLYTVKTRCSIVNTLLLWHGFVGRLRGRWWLGWPLMLITMDHFMGSLLFHNFQSRSLSWEGSFFCLFPESLSFSTMSHVHHSLFLNLF